jgi:hypothetical protein
VADTRRVATGSMTAHPDKTKVMRIAFEQVRFLLDPFFRRYIGSNDTHNRGLI